jgi:hypothetical protein
MTALVKALRGHCSIISWMAGNELFNAEIQGTPLRALALRGEKLAKALNPKRRYFISSYALGDGLTDEYDHWGRRTSLPSSFENALQGTPKMSVEMSISHTVFTGMPWRQFERLFPKWSKQWPPEKKIHMNRINNADWNQEFYCDSFGVQKIDPQTAAPFENWKDLLYYSSCYSGFSMATLIMNWRAHLFYNSGALPWCWHDQCPMVGMGMIDGYEAPKALYYFVKRAYLPQFMTMKYEAKQFDVRERLRSWIRIINEAGKTMKGHRPELFWYDSKFNLQLKIDSQKPFGLHGVNPIHQSGDHVAMRLSNQSVASGTWEEVGDLNGLGYLFPWYKLLGHPWVQDESPQLPDKSFFGIVLRLSDQQGRLVSQDFYPFNFDWYPSETVQQLPQARLVLESLRKTARGYSIAIKNDSKALFPWIELEALDFNLQDYHLSDNYFTLLPNEERELEFISRNPKQKIPPALAFQYRGLNGSGQLRGTA